MMHRARSAYILHLSRHRIGILVAFLLALLLLLLAVALFSARTAAAAPLLDGGNERPWARDAVATLTAAGVVEGYPDGTYKGDRSMTRDEAARLLSTAQARLAELQAGTASRSDLDSLSREIESLHDELESEGTGSDSAGGRVERLEDRVDHLDRPSL